MRLAANAIRVLVADMVGKAKSGHPGGSMGQADVAATLWLEYLKFVPSDPKWAGRDRLVFSGGHCSPLVYSLLHLSGTDSLSIDELKQFRQFGSRTATPASGKSRYTSKSGAPNLPHKSGRKWTGGF